MEAGKPQKQALAIAYSMKRRNAQKKASGGMINADVATGSVDQLEAQRNQMKQKMIVDQAKQKAENLKEMYPDPSIDKRAAERQQADEDLHSEVGYSHGGITKAIMKKRMMAEGGPADSMGLQDQEMDSDDFLSEFMPEQEHGHIAALEGSSEMSDDPKARRKGMISKIMADLHMKHMGK